jgi:hypothetical protein
MTARLSKSAMLTCVFLISLASGTANAAAGWTDFGSIIEFNQQPSTVPGNEALFIRVSVTTNPCDSGACHTRDGFYMPITTDLQKRLFAMLMLAKASDKRVRVYVTANCHLWGYAEMQGLVIE